MKTINGINVRFIFEGLADMITHKAALIRMRNLKITSASKGID